jgi:hypothetical protein
VTAELLMIVPSRGRPQNVAALLEAWAETTTGSTDLWIALDEDDPELAEYKGAALLPTSWPGWSLKPPRWITQERLRLGGTLNTIAVPAAANYRAVGFLGDDHRPRTMGWDRRMVEALDELGTGLVYGDDLFQRQNLPTAIAMTSDIVRALGYMVPGGLVHLYVDNAWAALGNGIGRLRYLPDVVIEHLHPSAGKAEMDDSYRETNSDAQFDADRHRFEDWKRFGLDADVARLQELIRRG